jgi:hypothetical protein
MNKKRSRVQINKIIRALNGDQQVCEDETNCYNIADYIVGTKSIKAHIHDLNHLWAVITNNVNDFDNCYMYRINVKVLSNNKSTRFAFNHSFVIVQCANYFTLCDAWSGIHFIQCRRYTKLKSFAKWFVNFKNFTDIYKSFGQEPFKQNNFANDFINDYNILVASGEYSEKYNTLINPSKNLSTVIDIRYYSVT